MSYDYTNKDLRAAAVAYAIQQAGQPRSAAWNEQIAGIAESLGCRAAELTQWATSKGYAELDPMDAVELDEQTRAVMAMEEHELPSEAAGILRAVLEFMRGEAMTTWKIARNSFRVPDGGSWGHFYSRVRIAGFPQCGKCGIMIHKADGEVCRVLMFARVRRVEGRDVHYRQLVPFTERDPMSRLMRLAVLESVALQDQEPSWGKAIAEEFRVSEPAVHYARVKLREMIRAASQGRAGLAGMLNKQQSNYGVPRVGGCNQRANHHQP